MSCSQCADARGKTYHDRCRTHAYCSREFRYFAAPCVICQELWERAKDIDSPVLATVAFDALEDWIAGFRRNSRHREKGVDYFFDPAEREAFQDLHALHTNLKIASQMDDPPLRNPLPSVSKSYKEFRFFAFFEL